MIWSKETWDAKVLRWLVLLTTGCAIFRAMIRGRGRGGKGAATTFISTSDCTIPYVLTKIGSRGEEEAKVVHQPLPIWMVMATSISLSQANLEHTFYLTRVGKSSAAKFSSIGVFDLGAALAVILTEQRIAAKAAPASLS